jgi:hypothetical protein
MCTAVLDMVGGGLGKPEKAKILPFQVCAGLSFQL